MTSSTKQPKLRRIMGTIDQLVHRTDENSILTVFYDPSDTAKQNWVVRLISYEGAKMIEFCEVYEETLDKAIDEMIRKFDAIKKVRP